MKLFGLFATASAMLNPELGMPAMPAMNPLMMSLLLGDDSSSLTSDPLMPMMMMGQGGAMGGMDPMMMSLLLSDSSSSLTSDPLMLMMMMGGQMGQMNPLMLMTLLGDKVPKYDDLKAECDKITDVVLNDECSTKLGYIYDVCIFSFIFFNKNMNFS